MPSLWSSIKTITIILTTTTTTTTNFSTTTTFPSIPPCGTHFLYCISSHSCYFVSLLSLLPLFGYWQVLDGSTHVPRIVPTAQVSPTTQGSTNNRRMIQQSGHSREQETVSCTVQRMVELPMPLYHPSNNFKNDKTTKCTYRYTLEPYKQLTCKSTIGALIRLTPSIDLMSSSFDNFEGIFTIAEHEHTSKLLY